MRALAVSPNNPLAISGSFDQYAIIWNINMGAAVSVLSKAQAEAQAKKVPRHHKIRYIVGGVVIALVVVAGVVFLIRRQRRLADY